MTTCSAGDIVTLIPSGLHMIVERELGDDRYYCTWFSSMGKKVGNEFCGDLLEVLGQTPMNTRHTRQWLKERCQSANRSCLN